MTNFRKNILIVFIILLIGSVAYYLLFVDSSKKEEKRIETITIDSVHYFKDNYNGYLPHPNPSSAINQKKDLVGTVFIKMKSSNNLIREARIPFLSKDDLIEKKDTIPLYGKYINNGFETNLDIFNSVKQNLASNQITKAILNVEYSAYNANISDSILAYYANNRWNNNNHIQEIYYVSGITQFCLSSNLFTNIDVETGYLDQIVKSNNSLYRLSETFKNNYEVLMEVILLSIYRRTTPSIMPPNRIPLDTIEMNRPELERRFDRLQLNNIKIAEIKKLPSYKIRINQAKQIFKNANIIEKKYD